MSSPEFTKSLKILTATALILCAAGLFGMGSQAAFAAQPDQRLDGIWIGTEKLSFAARTDCPKSSRPETLPAKIAIAQNGSLLAVIDGYGQGRYTDIHWSGDALVFQLANKRTGELRLSSDGKTLIEEGFVRRTATIVSGQREGGLSGKAPQVTGFTACMDELTGTFHREK